jgi:hypothetical protein
MSGKRMCIIQPYPEGCDKRITSIEVLISSLCLHQLNAGMHQVRQGKACQCDGSERIFQAHLYT